MFCSCDGNINHSTIKLEVQLVGFSVSGTATTFSIDHRRLHPGQSTARTVISKLLPPSNIAVISAMQNDWYYCFLVPLTLPIVVVAVYFHWLSMKMFKHA